MIGYKRLLRNNKGAVLLVVLFVIILLVGLAYALTIVSISTYQSALNEVSSQQAAFEAKSAAQVISNQLLEEQFITSRFINQLTTAGVDGQLTGTYKIGDTGSKQGQFEIYYPDFYDKSIIHITVTSTVGTMANSVTTVLRGEPMDLDEALDDYNLYITSPHYEGSIFGTSREYNFDYMKAEPGGVMKMYISTDSYGNYLKLSNVGTAFPYEGTGSEVTISGDLTMENGIYNAMITAYGTLVLKSVNINGNVYIRDSLIGYSPSNISGNVMAYGGVEMTGSDRNTYVVDNGIIAGGIVKITNGRVGMTGSASISNKANVILNNARTQGAINSQGSLVHIYNDSYVAGSIYSKGDMIIDSSTIVGNIHCKGNLTLINTLVQGSVKADGNVIMNDTTVNSSLTTMGNLTMQGSSKSVIKGNCIINGKITTSNLASGLYHEFGVWGNNSTYLSITQPTGDWDRGEQAVKLFSVQVAGTIKTPHKVVFTDNGSIPNPVGYKSRINTLYIQHDYKRFGSIEEEEYQMRLFGTDIINLYLVDLSGNAKNGSINGTSSNEFNPPSEITNLYGGSLYLSNVTQPLSGKYDGTYLNLGVTKPVYINGNVYSTGTILINSGANFSSNANVYAPTGFIVEAFAGVRSGNFYAGGTTLLNGNIGNLFLESSTNAFTVPIGVTVNGNLKSTGTTVITVNGTVQGSLYTQGVVTVTGTVAGNLKTPALVTINSGATIGDSNAYQLYSGGINDNGGATINSNIFNNNSSKLEIESVVTGYIYTLGNIEISYSATPIGSYVIANGAGLSSINRTVLGNIEVSGSLSMNGAGNNISVGIAGDNDSLRANVKAANVVLNDTIVSRNVHATGSGMAINMEASHIRGSAYAQSATGNMRLGGSASIGFNLVGDYTSRTAIYCGGELNFSATNQAYGNVHCGSFKTEGTLEGSGNTIHGNLYATSTVLINHTSDTTNGGVSSYQGIYALGSITISDAITGNGTIVYIRGVGTVNVNNYIITGEVYGPANITLTNTPSYKVHPRDGSGSPTHWVKLLGNSPVTNDVWSGNGFEQSSGSYIGGNLRVDNSSGITININAGVQGTVYIQNGALVNVASELNGLPYPKAIGGTLYATSGVTVGANSSIGGNVSCLNGNISIGIGSAVGGNVTTDLTSGGAVTIDSNSPVTGGIGARGNISTQIGSTVGVNVYSHTGTVTLRADVEGSVYAANTVNIPTDNVTISGHIRSEGTDTVTLRGSVYGNIWVNGPLTVSATEGSAGSRRLGTTTANTVRCNGAFSSSNQYIIKGSINNIIGNMTINNNIEGSVECPNGVLVVNGNVGGQVRSAYTTTVTGNIGSNLYVYPLDGVIRDVIVGGTIGGEAVIKGNFIQGGAVSGETKIEGGYVPNGIYVFPNAISINGDLTINFGANNGQLGGVGTDINVTGTLTLNVDSTNYVNVYGRILCGNLRVNRNDDITDIIDKADIDAWSNKDRNLVRFYADVHVVNNAYISGATFYGQTANGTGSSVFVGRHLAARDSNFYARGWTSENIIASNTGYGSVSVGYGVIGVAGASAGVNGSLMTMSCSFYSKIQAKGDVHLLFSNTARTGLTDDANQKMAHYIGGNLILEGSHILAHGGAYPTYDTLTIVNGNCTLIYNTYATYIGAVEALNREGYMQSHEGLFVGGTLNIGSNCAIYVDTYAGKLVNDGLIQIGKKSNI